VASLPESRRVRGRRAGGRALAFVALFSLILIWFFVGALLNELLSNRVAFYVALLGLGLVFARVFNRLDDLDSGRRRGNAVSEQPRTYGGEQQDVRILARRLVILLETARPLPILRGQVRLSSAEVYDVVARIRFQVEASRSLTPLLAAAEAVEDAVYHALPVPLMDEVRLPRERVEELLRRLRAAGA
jgi:hypothetical protein